jgi:3-oxoacyl-[acyl-carrier protein] reductase
MAIAYLALGSNLGDRHLYLATALRRLRAEPGSRLLAVSAVYETAPVGGPPGQGAYLNATAKFETDKTPVELLEFLIAVEREQCRVRDVKDGPRTLDLDVLLFDDQVLETPQLVVPHPRLQQRSFVLKPLSEIAGNVVHPVLKKTIDQLLQCAPVSEMTIAPSSRAAVGGLLNQRALVTGSTSGIGKAIADEFELQGATVLRHGSKTADFRDPVQIDKLAAQAADLDILVCNAGADTLTGPAAQWAFDDKLEALLQVDLKSTMRLARAVGVHMQARGRGVILTVGWDQAWCGMDGDSGQLFAATKGAVMAFTKSLAKTLAPQVRVNCIAPGWIRTAWGETASPTWQSRVRRETPLARWGLPEDVAAAAAYLASPAASFITSQIINVNGGAV